MIDLSLYRKLANTYDVDSSEQNAINQFVKQSDKIWDSTLSMYDILSPSKRGDDVLIENYVGETIQSRGVFNYTKSFNKETMLKGVERVYLALDTVKLGYYVTKSRTSEKYLIVGINEDKFNFEEVFVQRCSDYLRFYDDKGVYHSVQCSIESDGFYDLKKEQMVMIPDNQLRILVQYNDATKLIKWSDIDSADNKFTRFLLEGYPYRAVSIDRHTGTQFGEGFIDIRLQADQIYPDKDDLVNNIAGGLELPTIEIQNGSSITIGEAQELQLNTLVTYKGVEIENPSVTYTSSDETIATVDVDGVVTTILSGNVTITANYSTVSTTIDLTVSAVIADNYTVDIYSSNGIADYIRVGQALEYTALSLNNGEEYVNIGSFLLLEDDGITPLTSNIVTIVSTVDNTITLKASSDGSYVGSYFRLKYVDSNAENELRIQMKSVF